MFLSLLVVMSLDTTNKDKNIKTQSIVLAYLSEEKKAAQWRNSNTDKSKEGDCTASGNTGGDYYGDSAPSDDDDNTSSSFASAQGHRGQSGGYRGHGGRGRGGRGQVATECLLCGEHHALHTCDKWMDTNTDKRFLLSFAFSNRICTRCLRHGHNYTRCKIRETDLCPCNSGFNIHICCTHDDCRYRNNWDDETNTGNNTTSRIRSNNIVVNKTKIGQAILPIQHVKVNGFPDKKVVTLWDNCSQNSFIKEKTAEKLKLKGEKISFILITTDGKRSKMSGTLYELEIVDTTGEISKIQVIGLKELSTRYSGFTIVNIKKSIKKIRAYRGFNENKVSRNNSDIDLLIGSDLASLHPRIVTNIGELVILKSKFGSGWCVMGHNAEHVKFTSNIIGTRANFVGVEEINFRPSPKPEPKTETTDQQPSISNMIKSIWSNITSASASILVIPTLVMTFLGNLVLTNEGKPEDHDNIDQEGNEGRADDHYDIKEEENEDRAEDHDDNEGHEGTDDRDDEDNNNNSEVKNDDQDVNERILPPTNTRRKRKINKKFLSK